MAVDANVVGRVGEDQVDLLTAEQQPNALRRPGIATQQSMATQLPEIAGLRNGNRFELWNTISGVVLCLR